MAEETPTLEPEKEPEVNQPTVEEEAKALLSELETLGIDSPEQIKGMAKASGEAGNLGNLLGEVRRENQELRTAIEGLKPQDNLTGFETPSIDLKAEVKAGAKEVLQEMFQDQRQSQQAAWSEYANIQGDRDFSLVKDVWEKHMTSPQVQMAIGNNQTTMTSEYGKVVRTYYRKIAQRSRDLILKLDEAGVKVPHTETGQIPPLKPEEDDEKEGKLKKIKEESTGSDDDIGKMIDAILPNDDPFFQP